MSAAGDIMLMMEVRAKYSFSSKLFGAHSSTSLVVHPPNIFKVVILLTHLLPFLRVHPSIPWNAPTGIFTSYSADLW